jgi:multiple sugar transport system substrate-binding protein
MVAILLAIAGCGGGSSFDEPKAGGQADQKTGKAALQMLIASSGDAETKFVTDTATAWATKSGNTVEIIPATDIAQQLSQGLAGGDPPDVFYVDAARFADLAKAGSLEAYADKVADNDDFYESLRKTFTYDGKQYCVPKDFSTLALEIRADAWKAAGLTDADVPTTWEDLAAVAKKLTTGKRAGLVIGDTRDRMGAFMVQSGGWVLNEDSTQVTASASENVAALTYLQEQLKAGTFQTPSQVDAGWGGEAFGTGKAAMTIEGNWIRGAMKNDYPKVKYTVHELPEGPAGKGTLLFTQCYGVAAASKFKEQSVDLVKALTTAEAQLAAADAFGVMPSRQSAKDGYVAKYPDDAPFVAGAEYGQGPVNAPGMESVLADFDSGLQQLKSKNPESLLSQLQKNAESALKR